MFENANGFGIVGVFEATGAGEIAERSFINRRSEVGQRNFPLCVSIGRLAAEKAGFLSHLVLDGALDMVLHMHRRSNIAEDGRGLSEGRGSAKNAKENDGDKSELHNFIPVLGERNS